MKIILFVLLLISAQIEVYAQQKQSKKEEEKVSENRPLKEIKVLREQQKNRFRTVKNDLFQKV